MLSRKATYYSPVKIVSLSHSSTATISRVGKGTEKKWYMVMLTWFTDKEHNLEITRINQLKNTLICTKGWKQALVTERLSSWCQRKECGGRVGAYK